MMTSKLTLSPEEVALVMKYRQEQYNKNRPDKSYSSPCKYAEYDMEGVHCSKGYGRGVGCHCWARLGKECRFYEEEPKD